MDTNLYALERHAEAKIAEARRAAARGAVLEAVLAPGAVRVIAGTALIRLGRWLTARTVRRRDVPVEVARSVCAPGWMP